MYNLDEVKGFFMDFLPEHLTLWVKVKIFIDLLAGRGVRLYYKRVSAGWLPEPLNYPVKLGKEELVGAQRLQKEAEDQARKAILEVKRKTKKELKAQQERIEKMVS